MTTTPLKKSDFNNLYAFWQKAGLQLYPEVAEEKRFYDMLDLNPDLCFCLVDENNEIMATILGGFDGRTATINRLAVHPQHQKKGLGSILIAELEKKLKVRGIKKIALMIHTKNAEVVPFYEKLGFAEMNYVKLYYKDI